MRFWTGSPDRGLIDFKAAVSRVKRVDWLHTHESGEAPPGAPRTGLRVKISTVFFVSVFSLL